MPASTPNGWQRVRLGKFAQERGDRARDERPEVYSVTKHDGFVRSADYFDRQVFSRDVSAYRLVRRGDFAYATIHLDEGSIGLFDGADTGLISPMYTVFEVDADQVDRDFLYAYLKQPQMVQKYRRLGDGTVHRRKSIRFESLAKIEVELPPLPEQRAIAAVLDAVDDTIERTEAVIAATEELRSALIHELLTRGVPGWHSEWKHVLGLGTVPACWDVRTLGEVGQWMSGGTPSKDRKDYWSGSIPWISAKDMKVREIWDATDRISEEAARVGSRIVPEGTVLMVVRGMILAHSFPIAITRVPCAFNQDLKAVVCREEILPDYLLAVLDYRRRKLLDLPTTSSHGTMRIISDDLFSIQVPVPPPGEQQRVVAILLSVNSELTSLRSSVDGLKASKQALADALLTGRLRVPVRDGVR